MNIARYMKLLKVVEDSGSMLMCTSCGVETLSLGSIGVCSNCESLIYTTRNSMAGTNPDLLNSLEVINKSVSDGDFELAIATYDSIGSQRPSLLYAEALVYIKYSNREVSNINYGRKGFMEENAVHRSKASNLISKSKRLITKAISLATEEMNSGTGSLDTVYALFLLQTKLGRLKSASGTLQVLNGMGNTYLNEYAGVVFSTSAKRYDDALKRADAMMVVNHLPLNTFYYASLALFKKGMLSESTALLERLQHLMSSTNVESLLEETKRARDA
jgi:tetratricopeptide (TPR) repeat protein